MSRSSSLNNADLRRALDVVDATSGTILPGELVPHDLLVALAALVSADDATFEMVDPYRRTLSLQGLDPDESSEANDPDLVDLWWRAFWESCSYPQRTGDFSSIRGSGDDLAGSRKGRYWLTFAEAIGLGLSSELTMSLEPQGSIDRRLIMWREGRYDFCEADAALMGLIRPHIEQMLHGQAHRRESDAVLTARQLEVLRLVSTGCSNAEIARLLVLSPGTVRKHLENIFDRLGVQNRAAAIAWSRERGLI